MARKNADRNGNVWPNWTPIRFRSGNRTAHIAVVVPGGPRAYVGISDASNHHVVALSGEAPLRKLALAILAEQKRTPRKRKEQP